ncbi:unnamed protein product [Peniophora sp. CBMAI 1063]|nr:unnamed protein product [Peniophora sp. CBMAI 1063]
MSNSESRSAPSSLVQALVQARAANESLNELTLPSRLPAETLAGVFAHLVDIYPIDLDEGPPIPSSFRVCPVNKRKGLGWLYVTHVCRRWRATAISEPSLWTRLPMALGQLWDVFLARAKKAPLVISHVFYGVSSPSMDVERSIRCILQHRDHIQELDPGSLDATHMLRLVQGLTGPLPHLRRLRLQTYEKDAPLLPLPPSFMTESAPCIRELRLSGIAFPWGSGSSTITCFHYEHLHGRHPAAVDRISHSFSEVVSTLQCMPALKDLKLIGAVPSDAVDHVRVEIQLPQLEELEIVSHGASSWHLLALIQHPSYTHVNVRDTSMGVTGPGHIGSTTASGLPVHPASPSKFHVRTLDVDFSDPWLIERGL